MGATNGNRSREREDHSGSHSRIGEEDISGRRAAKYNTSFHCLLPKCRRCKDSLGAGKGEVLDVAKTREVSILRAPSSASTELELLCVSTQDPLGWDQDRSAETLALQENTSHHRL